MDDRATQSRSQCLIISERTPRVVAEPVLRVIECFEVQARKNVSFFALWLANSFRGFA